MKRKIICVLFMVLLTQIGAESAKDVMKAITINFTKALDVCEAAMDFPDNINKDFLNFWEEGYELSEPMTGCVILCLSAKLYLVDPDGSMHPGNILEFAKNHGADGVMAKQFVDILLQCETAAPPNDDACLKVLGTSKCFKAEIRKLNWIPDMELITREIVSGV